MIIKTGHIGIDEGIDITVKGNKHHVLSPTWELVMGLKKRGITWKQYEEAYKKLLAERYEARKPEFDNLLIIKTQRSNTVVLLHK